MERSNNNIVLHTLRATISSCSTRPTSPTELNCCGCRAQFPPLKKDTNNTKKLLVLVYYYNITVLTNPGITRKGTSQAIQRGHSSVGLSMLVLAYFRSRVLAKGQLLAKFRWMKEVFATWIKPAKIVLHKSRKVCLGSGTRCNKA